jgi:hypothetical protein
MSTNEVIDRLAKSLTPVRPLPPIGRRFAGWAAWALLVVGLEITLLGLPWRRSPDWARPSFWVSAGLALGASLFAAWAALRLSVPGEEKPVLHRRGPVAVLVLWALFELAAWAVALLRGAPFVLDGHWYCGVMILGPGLLIGAGFVVLLRRGVALNPNGCGALAALASVSFVAWSFQFACPLTSVSAHAVMWHVAPVGLAALLGFWLGRVVFSPLQQETIKRNPHR